MAVRRKEWACFHLVAVMMWFSKPKDKMRTNEHGDKADVF